MPLLTGLRRHTRHICLHTKPRVVRAVFDAAECPLAAQRHLRASRPPREGLQTRRAGWGADQGAASCARTERVRRPCAELGLRSRPPAQRCRRQLQGSPLHLRGPQLRLCCLQLQAAPPAPGPLTPCSGVVPSSTPSRPPRPCGPSAGSSSLGPEPGRLTRGARWAVCPGHMRRPRGAESQCGLPRDCTRVGAQEA